MVYHNSPEFLLSILNPISMNFNYCASTGGDEINQRIQPCHVSDHERNISERCQRVEKLRQGQNVEMPVAKEESVLF